MEKVNVNNIQLAYARRGKGIPLVLLHGWPDIFYPYHKVIPALAARGFDVIVPSLPGFPLTGPAQLPALEPTRYTAGLIFRLLAEVLGYPRFAVSGSQRHTDGGARKRR